MKNELSNKRKFPVKVRLSPLSCVMVMSCCLMINSFGSTNAFGMNREGPFLNLGIGTGLSADWQSWVNFDSDSIHIRNEPLVNLNCITGYSLSDHLDVFLTGRLTLNINYNQILGIEFYSDTTVGIGSRYFIPFPTFLSSNQIYLTGCIGFATRIYHRKRLADLDNLLTGIGTSVGIGYEFSTMSNISLSTDYRMLTEQYIIESRIGPSVFPTGTHALKSRLNVITVAFSLNFNLYNQNIIH